MRYESIALPVELSGVMKIIQPGFTDGDNLVALGQLAKLFYAGFERVLVIGMDTRGTEYMIMVGDALMHAIKGLEVDSDTYHASDRLASYGREQFIEVVIEVIQIDTIQVAV